MDGLNPLGKGESISQALLNLLLNWLCVSTIGARQFRLVLLMGEQQ